eukprot:403351537
MESTEMLMGNLYKEISSVQVTDDKLVQRILLIIYNVVDILGVLKRVIPDTWMNFAKLEETRSVAHYGDDKKEKHQLLGDSGFDDWTWST